MARVLITGATGCLGARLVDTCLHAGDDVIAIGRDTLAGAQLSVQGAHFVHHDLTQPLPARHLYGVDTVYHCAALSSAWGDPRTFQAVNVTATAALLRIAQQAGVGRFVFASSPSIYANGADRLNLPEDAPLPKVFASHYARTKFLAEQLVMSSDNPRGMRTTAMRPRAIYGTGDRSLMPRLLAAMQRGKVPMIAGGGALVDITHVSDAARAMHLLGHHPAAGGQVFNITSGETLSFGQILQTVSQLRGLSVREVRLPYSAAMAIASVLEGAHRIFAPLREPVLTRQAVASLGRSLTLNIEKARSQLGYQPQTTLQQGVQDYA
ncbi:NAD-dependent epimerase/dehydratase [Ketogulonicigenium robustum]|uniref:NAD-dependent epimerase/dehydratase n=1 Tax=Ketogulonicigenium robustum TaxID=92947 RepID=A0A1W6NWC3_9RHOB|nr:NAD-dependent epimerase/dehydratase family protein [Ketogulonicigenium robustum]ARO13420.1 NAD-dependent epimerase/dehydratase [Ketogulonicigenium robustum]